MGWEKSPGQGGREEYKSVESGGHNRVAAETQQALNKCLVNDWRDEVKEIDQEPRTEGSGRLGREPHALSAHGFPRPTMSTPILALPTRQPTPARVHTAPCRGLGSRRAPSWPRPRVCVLCAACRGPFLLSRLPRRSLSSVFAQRCPHAGSSACTGPGPGGPRHPAGAGSEPACLPAPRPPCLAHSLVAVTGHLNPAEGLGWQLQPETGSRLVPGAARGRPR